MALTPEDVVNKRFQPTKFREGYDQDEVDDFLDEVVVELRRLGRENEELRARLGSDDTVDTDGGTVGTDTVTDVSVKASRARLRVLVDSVAARDRNKAIDEDIRSRLAPSLGALERPPRLKISVKNEGAS